MASNVKHLIQQYSDIISFFEASGGSYIRIDDATMEDLWKSMVDGRLIIERDTNGDISFATNVWLISEEDLPLVMQGIKPAVVSSGNIVYVADHAGVGAYRRMIGMLRSLGFKTACWHHRYKSPERFRIYRSAS